MPFLQIRAILFGITIVASVGVAVYHMLNQRAIEGPLQNNSDRGRSRRKDISLLPRRRRHNTQENPLAPFSVDCVICLEHVNITNNGNGIILECQHTYHLGCIDQWMRKDKTCPQCRQDIGFAK